MYWRDRSPKFLCERLGSEADLILQRVDHVLVSRHTV